ncbi:MAG: hypothetical protein CVU86_01070 [Firmicutes bacterium HGW-Firmicutes-11]|jgi:signal transduction histidine kinase|nr:MAG: hypothetical protein CVU86_01070 [Firmicutes bacterium HGW-Firmicutes-11]
MRRKLQNQFVVNYILMFVITTMIAAFAFLLMDFSSDVISKTLVKNNYTADMLMEPDYRNIDTTSVVENGGGVQVVDENMSILLSVGIDTLPENLTVGGFTEFLTKTNGVGHPFSYSVAYDPQQKVWLIVTFPVSVRIDFAIAHNEEYMSVNRNTVTGIMVAIALFYLILLAISTVIYSKLTSISVVSPLKALCASAKRICDGDYSARVDLNLRNEFGDLESIFNCMAEQIESEISLRKRSEDDRKRLILDVSHDLKNPLSSIMGYAEICHKHPELTEEERKRYGEIIFENSRRANRLISDLFELSKVESPEYTLSFSQTDICEYLREQLGTFIPALEDAGFGYRVAIPEKEIPVFIDGQQLSRVFENLITNAIQYNTSGTRIEIDLEELPEEVLIRFRDDGVGMPEELAADVFQPFVRGDPSRNSAKGGTGLGLAIAQRIVHAHGGTIQLQTAKNQGTEFMITVPKM